jgi:heat shock protein HslJ
MKHFNTVLLLVVLIALAPACVVPPTPTAPTHAPSRAELTQTRWVLVAYGQPGAEQDVLEGTQITANFDEDGRVSGSAGCNQYFAAYTIAGKELTIAQLAFTEMACLEPTGVMEQEQAFLAALQGVHQFDIVDGQLQLQTTDGQLLTFHAA